MRHDCTPEPLALSYRRGCNAFDVPALERGSPDLEDTSDHCRMRDECLPIEEQDVPSPETVSPILV